MHMTNEESVDCVILFSLPKSTLTNLIVSPLRDATPFSPSVPPPFHDTLLSC